MDWRHARARSRGDARGGLALARGVDAGRPPWFYLRRLPGNRRAWRDGLPARSITGYGAPTEERTMLRVIMTPLPPCPTSPRLGALERKRRLWWGDERRNRAVAAVARAVAAGDSEALLGLGLRLTPRELEA